MQVVPHITDAIKSHIFALSKQKHDDFVITEIGGSVGDIESLPFIEAIRQIRWELPEKNFLSIHLTLIPYLASAKELKTKPTQHSVKQLQAAGITPDILVCRTTKALSDNLRKKIAVFCNVAQASVIEAIDVDSIYEVPLRMYAEKLDEQVLTSSTSPLRGLLTWCLGKIFLKKSKTLKKL